MSATLRSRSFRIRLGDAFLPKSFGGQMMSEHLLALLWIIDLDALHAFARPVEKERGRRLAYALLHVTNFHIERSRGSEAERLRVVRDDAYQEPAALPEIDRPERTALHHFLVGDAPCDRAVLDDLDETNRVLCRQLGLEVKFDSFVPVGPEDMTGQLAVGRHAQEGAVGEKRATGFQTFPPPGVGQ